jgi:sugar O-acyltransferase (sialic acid O-acetyltransferase NeuD family)
LEIHVTVERRILILGAGGHAKVVIDIVETAELGTIVGILDDDSRKHGAQVLGYTVLGGRDALNGLLADRPLYGLAAIGDNRIRKDAVDWFVRSGGRLLNAIHSRACVARSAKIGGGSVVMAGAVINPDATIGSNVIVNTGSIVEHDCMVGDHAHLAPSSVLCGGVEIGEGAFIGVGAKIVPGVQVGNWAIVGAGATVLAAIPVGAVAVGVPARLLR